MSHRNDISYGRYVDSGPGQRYSDSDVDQPSDDSDVSAAPTRRSKGSAKSSRQRGPKLRTLNRWTQEEHDRLAYLVTKWGSEKNWAKVAEEMPGRTGKQCRERWLNHMKPGIVKGNWSFEEEFLLAQCHAVVGSHWSKMTKRLPGRTENSIKNFWNATLRSKAPQKRRGVLWMYMQQQTCQEGENMDAFLVAVARLYDSKELPAYWTGLMDTGKLTERILRSVLRQEKEFLENPDTQLHPLALPHPSHGLCTAAETAAAAAAGLNATQGGGEGGDLPAADTAAGRQVLDPQHSLIGGGTSHAAADTAAAGGRGGRGSSYRGPGSPLPAPGLTPRFPGGEGGPAPGFAVAAAFEGTHGLVGLGLNLPPDVLAALGTQEVWPGLPGSSQAPVGGHYGAAPNSMEPLLSTMGLASDLQPAGHQQGGVFSGGVGSIHAPHDSLWGCLPSIRGLVGKPPAAAAGTGAGGYTPSGVGDPLKLLEPYGCLQGHHSSSNSMQTRPGAALEAVPPHGPRAAAAAVGTKYTEADHHEHSQGLAEVPSHSGQPGSRPGSSQGIGPAANSLNPTSVSPDAGFSSHGMQQRHAEDSRGGGFANHAPHSVPANSTLQEASMQHHAVYSAAATDSPYESPSVGPGGTFHQSYGPRGRSQLQQGPNATCSNGYERQWGAPQQQQQQGSRGSSPEDEGAEYDLAHEAPAPGYAANLGRYTAGHAADCGCLVCCVHHQNACNSTNSLGSTPDMYNIQPWDSHPVSTAAAAATEGDTFEPVGHSAHHVDQDYAQDWPANGRGARQQQQRYHPQQQQHTVLDQWHSSRGLHEQQQLLPEAPPLHFHNSSHYESSNATHQQQHRTGQRGQSPFDSPATTAWDAPMAASAVAPPWAPAEAQQQQQAARSRLQDLHLGSLPAAIAAGLFSPHVEESPMGGALQQLLDSAAAQSGIRAQDICAWLSTNTGGMQPRDIAAAAAAAAASTGNEQQVGGDSRQQQQWQQEGSYGAHSHALTHHHQQQQQQHMALTDRANSLGLSLPVGMSAGDAAHESAFTCSILEALLSSRHATQISDILLSPGGLPTAAALLHGGLPPTPAGFSHMGGHMGVSDGHQEGGVGGIKRERSLNDPHDDFLIDQPGHKLPRVF